MAVLTRDEQAAINEFLRQICQESPESILKIMWDAAHRYGFEDSAKVHKDAIDHLMKREPRH